MSSLSAHAAWNFSGLREEERLSKEVVLEGISAKRRS
jgi:hypothetical protein